MSQLLLKNILKESVLLNEITEDTMLYHRSFDKFKVGDIIDPSVKFGDAKNGAHWLKSNFMEEKLEEARKNINPTAPSRFNCVYTSVIPNSAFSGKGYLYEVKPIGSFHTTLAYLINKMNNEFERGSAGRDYGRFPEKSHYKTDKEYQDAWKRYEKEKAEYAWMNSEYRLEPLFEWYWKGINVGGGFKTNTKWIEVLCEKVKVVGVGGDESYKYLSIGDKVELMDDVKEDFYGYDASGNKMLPQEEIDRVVKDFNGKEEKSFGRSSWKITIPKGTKAKVKAAVLDQSAIKDFDTGDYKGSYVSQYRVLKLIPDGYDFYIDGRRHIYNKNYGKKYRVPVNDIFRKI